MLFYTCTCFGISENGKGRRIIRKIILLAHFMICGILIINHGFSPVNIILLLSEILYIILFPFIYMKIYPRCSESLMNDMVFLISIGFIMAQRLTPENAFRQFIIIATGSILSFFVPFVLKRIRKFRKYEFLTAAAGIILLLATLILGRTSFGANISFTIGGLTFQPSELVKILFVLYTASVISRAENISTIIYASIVAAVHVLILVMSTDLGSALIFFMVYITMLYVGTGRVKYLIGGMLAGTGAAFAAYNIFNHIKIRISVWKNPWADIDNKGYQITQALFAIGTGGWFGTGLYNGLPEAIPVVNKDFVFAAVAEEFGIIYAICLSMICLGIFLKMMKQASVCGNLFFRLMTTGFGVMYIFQCFLTIGGAMNFIPLTGVTLPFVSYGGSSAIMSLIMFGAVQTVCISVQEGSNEKEKK